MYLSAHPLDDYKMELKYYCSLQMKDFQNLQQIRGREFKAGGIVASIKTGQTREKNNPYGIITLEDYSGSYELPLFGEDYKNFSMFLKQGIFLFIKGRVQERRYNAQLEVKLSEIYPLGEASKKQQIHNIRIEAPLQEITEDFVTELSDITQENQGNTTLHFTITDDEDETQKVRLFSRSKRVSFSNRLANLIDINPKIRLTIY